MTAINAQSVEDINAYCVQTLMQIRRMGKTAESEPSAFWKRLAEMWHARGLPVSQNGIATRLSMSQGSTRRWFTGETYPEIPTLVDIAKRGDTTLDYLVTGALPKHPIKKGSDLEELLSMWGDLGDAGRQHILESARAQYAKKKLHNPGEKQEGVRLEATGASMAPLQRAKNASSRR